MAEHGLSLLGEHTFVEKPSTRQIAKITLFLMARLVQVLPPAGGTVSAFHSIHKKETSALNLVPREVQRGPSEMNTLGILSCIVGAFFSSHFRTEGCISPGQGGPSVLCRCCPWLKGVSCTTFFLATCHSATD